MSQLADNLHNRVIQYSSLKGVIPHRQLFLNKAESAKVDNCLKNDESLYFLPTYLMETHMQDVKYGKANYKIILMGILRDGRRVNVVLDGITPFFEIQLPDGREAQEAAIDKIMAILENDELTTPVNQSIINAKPFKYYRTEKCKFLRLYYNKLKARSAAIQLIRKHDFTTASDDTASYYRVVCRDFMTTFSSWAILENYKKAEVDMLKGTTYRVDIKDYKQFTGELTGDLLKDKTLSCCWDIETWSKDGDVPQPDKLDDNIFCLSMTFQWVNEDHPFFKVCLCDYPANAKEGYMTIVCGSEKNIIKGFADVFEAMRPEFIVGFNDSDYDWNWVIKRAAHYKGLLSYIAGKFDSTKPFQPYTDDGILKWNFKKEHVKVEADTYIDGFSLMMHGYIPVDVRTIFRRLYPTAEQSSLKWFLAKNKLGGKEDMPYEEMFKIYGAYRAFIESHSDETSELIAGKACELDTEQWSDFEISLYDSLKKKLMAINYYCVIDAERCHDLMKIRSVIMDHREVSNVAYTSVYDAFYRANGMKVRNLTIAIGQTKTFGIRFSNITNEVTEDGKYPGAFVLPPKKGLKSTKLSVPERIRKAQMTKDSNTPYGKDWLNTTQEEIADYYSIVAEHGAVGTPELIKQVETQLGKKLPKKFVDFWTEPIGRPITGLDFSSLYPSLVMAYNFSPEYCILDKRQAQAIAETGQRITKVDFDFHGVRKVGYFVWHNNVQDPNEPGFQFGVYPYILNELFKKRAAIKKKMKVFDHRREEIEAMSDEEQTRLADEYNDVVFNQNYLKSKQLALKVFMNTFYGEAGNKRSPFFVMEVAGGITSYGQKNIRFAYAYVKEAGCNVYYGDTDSLYLSVPEQFFSADDVAFYSGRMDKLAYWTALVETTFKEINPIRDGVNQAFIKDNGTKFLSMAYEEVLSPVAFTAKKKYFGIAHENIPNFKPKELFIRGLEVKKRGVSELLRTIFMEIMWTCCNPDNVYDLMELVLQKIDEIYSRKWAADDFIQTGVYRPGRQNVKINTFVARMKERGVVIKPNERFNYVIVKRYPYVYDYRGRKVEISIGDKLELAEEYEKQNLEIDLDYYMQGSINGQLARLITYHDMFKVEPADNSDEELKIAEDRIYKNACKFIEEYCKKYYANYNTFGKTHQKIFKTASKAVTTVIKNKDEVIGDLLSANVNYDDFEAWFVEYTEKKADKISHGYGQEFITKELSKINELVESKYAEDADDPQIKDRIRDEVKARRSEKIQLLQKSYYSNKKSISDIREYNYRNTISILRKKLRENYQEYMAAFGKFNNSVDDVMGLMKQKIGGFEDLMKPSKESKDFTLEDFEVADTLATDAETRAEQNAQDLLQDKNFWRIINDLKMLHNNMLSAHLGIKRTRSIVAYLKLRRDHEAKMVVRPDDETIQQMKSRDLEESKMEVLSLDI